MGGKAASSKFRAGDERTVEVARKGGLASSGSAEPGGKEADEAGGLEVGAFLRRR